MLKVAVVGATGYTGRELVEILIRHQYVRPHYLTSESYAGQKFSDVYPRFRGLCDLPLEKPDNDRLAECDFIFAALPHGTSMKMVPGLLNTGRPVVDLSGDFRLQDPGLYPVWYGYEHCHPEYLKQAVYGLPESNREKIKDARLVANPGCYPTAVQLPLAPLLAAGVAEAEDIIIDAKSGVSGAGRAARQPYHFPECTENFKAYKITGHQHIPEIEQGLAAAAGRQLKVVFTPHLVPMVRGILATIYLKIKARIAEEKIWDTFREYYDSEPFIRLLEDLPETKHVSGTNYCDIAFRLDKRSCRLIVVSAIDNLVKGAAGQAVQNMNLMLGLPETAGLLQGV
jgi:N-acetyl-gamma-glutamyl-phosphate reductase